MKKIISLVLLAVMMALAAVPVGAAYDFRLSQSFINDESFSLGDLNGDGAVNAQDAYYMKA
ncbi:MAG: hypothetical protein IJF69_05160, partial [Clostridia bacterium]|nr:hypothetical protein [Clostridia bacterium]